MDPNSNISKDKNEDLKADKSNSILQNIKSIYMLKRIYINITKKKSLEIFRWNKKIQNRLNLSINDYKEYSEKFTPIEIEIIPCESRYGPFINIRENKKFYHIFFNDNKEEINDKYSINEKDKVIKIKIIIDYQVKSFENLFKNCGCIKSINFKKFHRNNIDNMSHMFYYCQFLEELNLSSFKTHNVSDMSNMFEACKSLKELNLSNFNTGEVTDMNSMFQECNKLEYLDLYNFNTSKVTNMIFMFNKCHKLKEIQGINGFNTFKVINMTAMFQECYELEYLDLFNFNTSKVTDMGFMFNKCHKLKKIKGINRFNTFKVTDMQAMFQECYELKYLDLSNFNTSNVTNMGWMFNECHKIKEIKGLNRFNTFKVTNMKAMFQECYELEYLDLSNFNTSNVTNMAWMFNECHKIKEIKGINRFNTFKVTNMKAMFQECYELEHLDLSNFNTSNVTNIGYMFYEFHKLKDIQGINNFHLTEVGLGGGVFDGCNNLNQLIFSKFNKRNENNNEKHIVVLFHSIDYRIQCFITCYISDNFTKVEEKLYDIYPDLKNKHIFFTTNGNIIKKSDNLEKNNIKSGTNILINYY